MHVAIQWNATDSSGNFATIHQRVTLRDTYPPEFEPVQDIIPGSGGPINVTFADPQAYDEFPVTVSCNPPSQSIFEPGRTAVECTAWDSSGNEATTSFYVIIPRSNFTITDDFDSLDGWQRFATGFDSEGTTIEPAHQLALSNAGNPAPSAKINGSRSSLSFAGMQKTFSLEGHTAGDPLYMSVDYRAVSDSKRTGHTNAALVVLFDGGPYYKWLAFGRTLDTGWQREDIGNIGIIIPDDSESITVRMQYATFDPNVNHNVYTDNLYIGTMPRPPSGASGGAAGGQAESAPVEISHDGLQDLLSGIENAALLCSLAEYDESLYDEIILHMQERGIDSGCLR